MSLLRSNGYYARMINPGYVHGESLGVTESQNQASFFEKVELSNGNFFIFVRVSENDDYHAFLCHSPEDDPDDEPQDFRHLRCGFPNHRNRRFFEFKERNGRLLIKIDNQDYAVTFPNERTRILTLTPVGAQLGQVVSWI